MTDVTVCVVNWNTSSLLHACLLSVLGLETELDVEVIVVDNASDDGSVSMVRESLPQVTLIENDTNLGFAKANNQAIRQSSGEYILLLNSDTQFIEQDTLDRMVSQLTARPDAGVIAPQLLNPDGSIQRSVRKFPTIWGVFCHFSGIARVFRTSPLFNDYLMEYWDHNELAEVEQPMGACLLIRREVLEEVGLLSEEFFMYYEDVEFCWRVVQRGWSILFSPDAKVLHHGGCSASLVAGSHLYERGKNLVKFMRLCYQDDPSRMSWVKLALGLGVALRLLYYWSVRFFSRPGRRVYGPMLGEGRRLLLELASL
jgi:GT2 family glycosyltransferase